MDTYDDYVALAERLAHETASLTNAEAWERILSLALDQGVGRYHAQHFRSMAWIARMLGWRSTPEQRRVRYHDMAEAERARVMQPFSGEWGEEFNEVG